jgi:hypothetical protein
VRTSHPFTFLSLPIPIQYISTQHFRSHFFLFHFAFFYTLKTIIQRYVSLALIRNSDFKLHASFLWFLFCLDLFRSSFYDNNNWFCLSGTCYSFDLFCQCKAIAIANFESYWSYARRSITGSCLVLNYDKSWK